MPDFVTGEFVAKTRTYATGPRGPRARSEEQAAWDNAFREARDGSGFLFAQVTPAQADDARKRVASAARLMGLATTEGEARPGKVEGTVILAWEIRTPTKRGPRAKKTSE